MSRIYLGTALSWVVVASLHVAAQDAGSLIESGKAQATPARVSTPRVLPGTRADVFATIRGSALTSTNSSLATTPVRLRDARIGQIVARQVTDSSGMFEFESLDPGSYIVEIVDQDQASVLAASEVLNVGAGEAISAVVKLPLRITPSAGIFGNTTSSAAALAAQAAASGVMAIRASGTATCETLQ